MPWRSLLYLHKSGLSVKISHHTRSSRFPSANKLCSRCVRDNQMYFRHLVMHIGPMTKNVGTLNFLVQKKWLLRHDTHFRCSVIWLFSRITTRWFVGGFDFSVSQRVNWSEFYYLLHSLISPSHVIWFVIQQSYRYFESRSNLSSISAVQLQRHPPNMIMPFHR